MAISALTTYLVAITLLTMTPGVDTLLVVRNTARGGWRDGATSSLGICCGLFLHASVSVAGISVILLQAAWAFTALKLAGALYLVWLGVGSWRKVLQRRSTPLSPGLAAGPGAFRVGRSLKEGFLSNALNPKTATFYLAFLPQFINPAQPAIPQALLLAGLHFVIAMIWQCLIALLVKRATGLLARPGVSRIFDGVTGTLMVGLGLGLAVKR